MAKVFIKVDNPTEGKIREKDRLAKLPKRQIFKRQQDHLAGDSFEPYLAVGE